MNASLQWGVSFFEKPLLTLQFRNGSISEVITLDTPCSGDEWKAEPICCLISGVSSSQFGQEMPLFVGDFCTGCRLELR